MFRFAHPKIADSEVQRVYLDALYGKSAPESCNAFEKLFKLDGLTTVQPLGLSATELARPRLHYMALVIPNRSVEEVSEKPYEPRYYRLNMDGR